MGFQRTSGIRDLTKSTCIRILTLAGLVPLFIACGCTGGELDSGRALLLTQAAAKRSIWENAAINDYEFVVQRSCFCGSEFLRPLRIQVRSGVVSSVTFSDTGDAVTNTALGPFPTLDDLFDDLQDQILEADNVNATFDSQYGFPTQYFVDPQFNVVDEEFGIAVSGFRIL